MFHEPYDTWERTEHALKVIHRTVHLMCELRPKSGTPEEKIWEAEMRELRKWIVQVHERRIALNIMDLKEKK
jgi:hypothetical protein